MKRLIIALCAAIPAALAGGCTTYGSETGLYAGGPYAYEGFYDDFYGPIYDGYWGDDGSFYYRTDGGDRSFRRGDGAHFSRGSATGANFHPMQGSMTPTRGMNMPHFSGGGAGHGRGHR